MRFKNVLIFCLTSVFFLIIVTGGKIRAYYNFMAPGVPPRAICKVDFGESKVDIVLESLVQQINVGDEFEIAVSLKNSGSNELSISSLQLYIHYDSNVLKAQSIKVNQEVLCGVSLDEDKTYIDTDKGVVSVYADQLAVDGCNPISLPVGESVEVLRIPFVALEESQTRIYVDALDANNPTAVFDFNAPDLNIVNIQGELTLTIGQGEVTPLPTNTEPTTTASPTPSQTTTSTPPPTGVIETTIGTVALLFGILGLLLYYIEQRDTKIGKIILD